MNTLKVDNYLKGSLNDYADSTRGYFTGSFFPQDTLEHDTSIEINYSELPASFSASAHCHSQSKSWVIVTKGAMYFRVGGEDVVVRAGEFLIFAAGVVEEVVKVDPDTASLTIHTPSIPGGDKVIQ